MPLSAPSLQALIKSNLIAQGLVSAETVGLDDSAEALAAAIVSHIVSNLTIVIPPGSVLVAATAGVPNPAPIPCTVA